VSEDLIPSVTTSGWRKRIHEARHARLEFAELVRDGLEKVAPLRSRDSACDTSDKHNEFIHDRDKAHHLSFESHEANFGLVHEGRA
jgi:hypothetical protein